MNKKLIRLTESDLHNIVKESVNRALNEIGDTKRGQNALGQVNGRASVRSEYADGDAKKKYRKIARDAMHKAYKEADKNGIFAGIGSAYDNGITVGQHKAVKESDLHNIVKESVHKILNETYTDGGYEQIDLDCSASTDDGINGRVRAANLWFQNEEITVRWVDENGADSTSNLLEDNPSMIWNILKSIKN